MHVSNITVGPSAMGPNTAVTGYTEKGERLHYWFDLETLKPVNDVLYCKAEPDNKKGKITHRKLSSSSGAQFRSICEKVLPGLVVEFKSFIAQKKATEEAAAAAFREGKTARDSGEFSLNVLRGVAAHFAVHPAPEELRADVLKAIAKAEGRS